MIKDKTKEDYVKERIESKKFIKKMKIEKDQRKAFQDKEKQKNLDYIERIKL